MSSARSRLFGPPLDTARAWADPGPSAVAPDAPDLPPILGAAPDPAALSSALDGLGADVELAALADPTLAALDAATDGAAAADPVAHQAQLLQLQAELQSQQLAMQTMSSILATQHQTSMAIIHNMGGGGPTYEARDLNQNGWIDPGE